MLSLFVWHTLPKKLETELPADIRKIAQRVSEVPTDKIGLVLITADQVGVLAQTYHAMPAEMPRFSVLLHPEEGLNTRGWCGCTLAHFSGIVRKGSWKNLRTMLCPLQRTLSFRTLTAIGGLKAIPEKAHVLTLGDFPDLPEKHRKHLEICATCHALFLDNAQQYLTEKLQEAIMLVSTQHAQNMLEAAIASGELPFPGMSPMRPRGRA